MTAEPANADESSVLPRVLLITPGALNRYRESGVTLTNLFEGWPDDLLRQIHADPSPPPEALGNPRFFDASGGARSSYAPLTRRAAAALRFATGRANTGLLWARLSASLREWLRADPPDVILSQTGNLAFLRLTRQIARFTGAPLVLYAADDWVNDWPASNLGRRVPPFTPVLARTVDREFAALVRDSVARMAISDAMAEAYARRYGGDWLTVPNPVDLDRWPERLPDARPFTAAQPFRVLYSGSLSPLSQLPGVREMALAVRSLHEAGVPIEFEVATHRGFEYLRDELEQPGVRMVDLVQPNDLPHRLASVDLLLMPMVFDEVRLPYIRLSMPGKAAEYLASGTPVLAYGPRGTAVIDHAVRHGWAEVVDARSIALLAHTLVRLMESPEHRRRLASTGRRVAREHFSVDAVRPRFSSQLREAATGSPRRG